MEKLAEAVGTSTSTINRIEKGETELISEWLPKLAAVFGVDWRELVALDAPAPPRPEAEVLDGADAQTAGIALHDGQKLVRVLGDTCTAIGIDPGDLLIADFTAGAGGAPRFGDVALLRVDDSKADPAPLLLRQFIEPDLFIANSKTSTASPVNRALVRVETIAVVLTKITTIARQRQR